MTAQPPEPARGAALADALGLPLDRPARVTRHLAPYLPAGRVVVVREVTVLPTWRATPDVPPGLYVTVLAPGYGPALVRSRDLQPLAVPAQAGAA